MTLPLVDSSLQQQKHNEKVYKIYGERSSCISHFRNYKC